MFFNQAWLVLHRINKPKQIRPNLWHQGPEFSHKARCLFNLYEWEIAIGKISFD